jgi:hypothetical protein
MGGIKTTKKTKTHAYIVRSEIMLLDIIPPQFRQVHGHPSLHIPRVYFIVFGLFPGTRIVNC